MNVTPDILPSARRYDEELAIAMRAGHPLARRLTLASYPGTQKRRRAPARRLSAHPKVPANQPAAAAAFSVFFEAAAFLGAFFVFFSAASPSAGAAWSTNSISASGALSPRRCPSLMIRV